MNTIHQTIFRIAGKCVTNVLTGNWLSRGPNPGAKETLVLTSHRSRAILGPLDILVDIGAPAEKEVIQ